MIKPTPSAAGVIENETPYTLIYCSPETQRRFHAFREMVFLACQAIAACAWGSYASAQDSDIFATLESTSSPTEHLAQKPEDERIWNFRRSIDLTSGFGLNDHRSATGTQYGGTNSLKVGFNIDAKYTHSTDTLFVVDGYFDYDLAYKLNLADYSPQVVNDYSRQYDVAQLFAWHKISESISLSVGRKIFNWGVSDTIRVLDVVNPVNLLSPGSEDIADLRMGILAASALVKIDESSTWEFVLIPERRSSLLPPLGSDFNSGVDYHYDRNELTNRPDIISRFSRRRSSFDIFIQAGWLHDNIGVVNEVLDSNVPLENGAHGTSVSLFYGQYGILGAGAYLPAGNFMYKGEFAYLIDYPYSLTSIVGNRIEKYDRADVLLGVEYSGLSDWTVMLDAASRHFVRSNTNLQEGYQSIDSHDIALSLQRGFSNDKGNFLLSLLESSRGNAFVRTELSYNVHDQWELSLKWLTYEEEQLDRLYLSTRFYF